MKAWEEHAADLYLLANDILENLYAQRMGQKSRFYYTFNPTLPYRKMSADPISQLKLLEQLADKGAVDFEIKAVQDSTPPSMVSKNALSYTGDTLLVHIVPRKLEELLRETQKYGKRVILDRSKAEVSVKIEGSVLMVSGYAIAFRRGNSLHLLKAMLENRSSRNKLWTHEQLYDALEHSEHLKHPEELVRNTANNVNKRVAAATSGIMPTLLQVSRATVQLDPRFV